MSLRREPLPEVEGFEIVCARCGETFLSKKPSRSICTNCIKEAVGFGQADKSKLRRGY